MTDTTDDDLFVSIESKPETVDPPEPTPEEIQEREFESGVAQVLGKEDDEDDRPSVADTLIAGMSNDEIKVLLEKARRVDELEDRMTKMHDKAFGTLGNLKQTIDELRNRPVGGGKPNISKETFKALSEYFDDESVAEALANDFANVQFDAGGTPNVNLDEKLSQIEQKFEIRLLDYAHADWRELYNSSEFAEWKGTLKPEAQEMIDHSWDGAAMAKAFTQFKNWRAKRGEAEQAKQQRLEAGIVPSGSGRSTNSAADDAFNQGLKKVVQNRMR